LLLLMLLTGLTGCDYYAKPNRPVPEQFEAQLLDGGTLNRSALYGKPWVISIWVPG
jgi:outer membrane lipopolysaccharide assembly protein LptE/RlpB